MLIMLIKQINNMSKIVKPPLGIGVWQVAKKINYVNKKSTKFH